MKGKDKIIEKIEIEFLEEHLKLENHEIAALKKEARKHNVQNVQFEKMNKIWEE